MGQGDRRLVRGAHRRSVEGGGGRQADRRRLRELGVRDQDGHREGARAELRRPDRRHRRDHRLGAGGGLRDPAAGGRQHHDAVGARAHQRARGAEERRLLASRDPRPGARRVLPVRDPRRRRGPRSWARSRSAPATRPAASCRSSTSPARTSRWGSSMSSCSASWPGRFRRSRRCGCASSMPCGGADRDESRQMDLAGRSRHLDGRADDSAAPRSVALDHDRHRAGGGGLRRRAVDRRGLQEDAARGGLARQRHRAARRQRQRDDERPVRRHDRDHRPGAGHRPRPGRRRRRRFAALLGRALRDRRPAEALDRHAGERPAARRAAGGFLRPGPTSRSSRAGSSSGARTRSWSARAR